MIVPLPPNVRHVILSLHPAFAMRGMPQAMPEIEAAIGRVRDPYLPNRRPAFLFYLDPTPQQLTAALSAAPASHALAIDVETREEDSTAITICGVSVAWAGAFVFPWTDPFIDIIAEQLASGRRIVSGHNLAFDRKALARYAAEPAAGKTWDTIQAEALLYPPFREAKKRRWMSLAHAVMRRFPIPYWKDWQTAAGKALLRAWFPGVPEWLLERLYCGVDVATTWMLRSRQDEELERTGMRRLFVEIVAPAGDVCVEMEQTGILVDAERLATRTARTDALIKEIDARVAVSAAAMHEQRRLKVAAEMEALVTQRTAIADKRDAARKALTPRIAKLRTRLAQIGAEFDAGNDNHWRALLFGPRVEGGLGLRPARLTGKTALGGVDRKDIEELQRIYPDVAVLADRVAIKHQQRRLSWLQSIEPDREGRAHFQLALHRTENGRVASGKDDEEEGKEGETGNIQNVPEADRQVFRAAPEMVWVEKDYSQIELRVMAWLARDMDLLNALHSGLDVHSENAAAVFGCKPEEARTFKVMFEGQRQPARRAIKRGTHGWDYGLGDVKAGKMFRPAEAWALDEVLRFLREWSNRTRGEEGISELSWVRRTAAAKRAADPDAEWAKLLRRTYDHANTLRAREWRLAYFKRWPGLARFQQRVIEIVSEERELINPFKRRLRFYGFKWDYATKSWVFTEREEALAFLPASTTADIAKAVLPAMAATARRFGGRLLTMTHDSYSAEVPADRVAAYSAAADAVLTQPWKQLGRIEPFGWFSCPVETKVGANWGPQHFCNEECDPGNEKGGCDLFNPDGLVGFTDAAPTPLAA